MDGLEPGQYYDRHKMLTIQPKHFVVRMRCSNQRGPLPRVPFRKLQQSFLIDIQYQEVAGISPSAPGAETN